MARMDAPPKPMVRKFAGRLMAVSGFDAEALDRFPDGTEFDLSPKTRRSLPHHRTYWRALDKAVKATGRGQLIIAGVVTEVCVAFPALSAIAEGYDVFVVTDASGTFNQTTRDAAWMRMQGAGVQLLTWFGTACELHRDWRNDVEGLATIFSNHLPAYSCLIQSYDAIQNAKKKAA